MKSYVDYELIDQKPKTDVFSIFSRSSLEELGRVYWYAPWRQYVIDVEGFLFSRGCLREIAGFLDRFMDEQKKRRLLEARV